MINKPKHLSIREHDLVIKTNDLILCDEQVTKREMDYVRRLYNIIYETEATDKTIINDLKELAGWKVKIQK